MEIKKENLLKALNTGSDSVKETILAIFPELKEEAVQKADKRPVTERIKTFEDACRELGEEHPLIQAYRQILEIATCEDYMKETFGVDMVAYLKLRIICAALNEGWEPKFTEDEVRWFPWFWLYTQDEINNMDEQDKQARHLISTGDYETEYAGFAFAFSHLTPSSASTHIGSRLCLKSEALAVYCGKQFIDLWADFNLVRRR